MLASFFALIAVSTAAVGDQPATSAQSNAERFAGREQARIAFESNIRGWRFEREGPDDILYVEGTRNIWYRAELSCFGLSSDADFALGMIPISHGTGFDRFSRVRFVDGFSNSRRHGTECHLNSLVELTEEEAFEFELRRRPRERASR
jgi:hypothetical protein